MDGAIFRIASFHPRRGKGASLRGLLTLVQQLQGQKPSGAVGLPPFAVPHIGFRPIGAAATGQFGERVAIGQGTILGQALRRTPATAGKAPFKGGVQGATIHAGLAAGDEFYQPVVQREIFPSPPILRTAPGENPMKHPTIAFLLFAPVCLAFAPDTRADPVRLQTGDVSCKTDSNRYVDCGNGTVTDNQTGLIWLKDASCLGIHDWYNASIEVLNLADGYCGLDDDSSPGEWRLPTREEWEDMVEKAVDIGGCDPTITNDAGTDCWGTGPSSFTGIIGFEFGVYWSATTSNVTVSEAYTVLLINGSDTDTLKSAVAYVWPVRGGQ